MKFEMGFSTNVHGQTAHEALLNRQDSELRLLETMRKCLQLKVKSDREYASALLSAVAQGQKVDVDDDLMGSGITQAWKSMMEGFEFVAKLIRQNADSVENKVLTKLNELFIDKRKVKKFYQDEHNRISQQFSRLVDDVSRKKVEYQKNLEMYKSMKSRLEEYYIKGGRVGKKLDEMRTKYQRTCRKLHQTHNEYVLLLTEAVEFEKDYRTILFPGLIESHQGVQENLVQSWKNSLEEAAKFSSLCTEQFRDLESRVIKIIEGIRPNQEYVAFSEKCRNPPSNISFTFDENLLLETPGKLLPNQLTVDNLTVDWLKSKLNELDAKIKDEQERMLELGESILSNGKPQDTLSKLSTSPELARKRRELIEMRCDERKLVRQFDLIKFALNDIGCEELPSGCDISIESTFTHLPETEGDGLDKKSEVVESEMSTSRCPSSQGLHKRSLSSHFNTLMSQFRRKSIPSTPVMSHKERKTPERRGKSVDKELDDEGGGGGGGEVCEITDENDIISFSRVRSNTNRLYLWYNMTKNMVSNQTKSLVDEEWFHGVLPREEVVRLLTREGDFLVRETTRNDECQTVLSVAWGGHKHFIVQTTPEGHFRFEGPAFPTVQELILHQYQSGLPVTSRSGAILRKPILRERWELNNDDVLLLDKIGRGNFGDVYKAKLKSTKQDVAVKTCRVALPDEQKRKFLQEGRILKQYDHPNIVKLIGICVQKQPIMIVMELVPGGSLLTFLRNKADILVQSQLLKMCRDAAAGMRYLESRNCIHRDLAARNCLIGHEDMVKISDFGMSREEEEYIVSDGMKQIPIKWTAPEALNFGKYTSLCDVWSYGVLAWEIFARGGVPYSGLSNSKAREKIDSGYRMPAPDGTPDEMYKLMLRCWEYQPESRPHFDEIYSVVNNLCSDIES